MVLTLDPAPNAPSYSNPDTFEPDTSNYLAWMKTIRDQLSGQALEIGDKVQSATDTTAGRLLTPGFMGLGQAIPLSGSTPIKDRNLAPGFYSYVASNVPGGPENISHYHGLMVTRDESSGRIGYLDFRMTASSPQFWIGTSDGTTIVWRRIDPERGSNPNGEYIKFSDGTMICWREVSGINIGNALGSIYYSGYVESPFPATFVTHPVGGGALKTTVTGWVNARTLSTTAWGFSAWAPVSRTGDTVTLLAIGRWY